MVANQGKHLGRSVVRVECSDAQCTSAYEMCDNGRQYIYSCSLLICMFVFRVNRLIYNTQIRVQEVIWYRLELISRSSTCQQSGIFLKYLQGEMKSTIPAATSLIQVFIIIYFLLQKLFFSPFYLHSLSPFLLHSLSLSISLYLPRRTLLPIMHYLTTPHGQTSSPIYPIPLSLVQQTQKSFTQL